jgi:chromosome segregation ATPase
MQQTKEIDSILHHVTLIGTKLGGFLTEARTSARIDRMSIMTIDHDINQLLEDIDRSARTLQSKIEVLAKTSRGAESDRYLVEDLKRREATLVSKLEESRARAEKTEKELKSLKEQYSVDSERFKAGTSMVKERLVSEIREYTLKFEAQMNKQRAESEAYQQAASDLTHMCNQQKDTIAELEATIENYDTWVAQGKEREAALEEELRSLNIEKKEAVANSKNIGDALDQVLSDMISEPAPDDPSKPFVPYYLR